MDKLFAGDKVVCTNNSNSVLEKGKIYTIGCVLNDAIVTLDGINIFFDKTRFTLLKKNAVLDFKEEARRWRDVADFLQLKVDAEASTETPYLEGKISAFLEVSKFYSLSI